MKIPPGVEMGVLVWVANDQSVEVTFEESRLHMVVETQQQWSDLATARTTSADGSVFASLPDGAAHVRR